MPKKKPVVKDLHKNCLIIENLPDIMKEVKKLMDEKEFNPGVVQEEDAGPVFLEGEAHMVVDGKYVKHEEAKLKFQFRKVVREYLVLQKMLKTKK